MNPEQFTELIEAVSGVKVALNSIGFLLIVRIIFCD